MSTVAEHERNGQPSIIGFPGVERPPAESALREGGKDIPPTNPPTGAPTPTEGEGEGTAENRNLATPTTPCRTATATRCTIEQARKVFQRRLHLPDLDVVDVMLAVPGGNKVLTTDPLWLFLKGPPGSGKTELLNALRPATDWTVHTSKLTPQALISGYMDPNDPDADHSLLPALDGKTLVVKDFTTVLSMPPQSRDEVFGILRDVYDGHATKHFGNGRRSYDSRFNFVAGVTSAIDSYWHLSALGERFLSWHMVVDPMQQARRALANANGETDAREEMADAAAGVLANLADTVPIVGVFVRNKLLTLAYLLARLRTFVGRDRNNKVNAAPECEIPTRIVKQLLRLAQSLALVRGQAYVREAEFQVVRKVALDSMPAPRLAIFRALLQADTPLDIATARAAARISHTPARCHLEDLVLLGLATESESGRKALFALTPETRTEWARVS